MPNYYNELSSSRAARQKFYQSKEWRAKREQVLMEHPLCVLCKAKGAIRLAEVIDHIEDIQSNPGKCLDSSNLQPLCKSCHSTKTTSTMNGEISGLVNLSIDFSVLD